MKEADQLDDVARRDSLHLPDSVFLDEKRHNSHFSALHPKKESIDRTLSKKKKIQDYI